MIFFFFNRVKIFSAVLHLSLITDVKHGDRHILLECWNCQPDQDLPLFVKMLFFYFIFFFKSLLGYKSADRRTDTWWSGLARFASAE